MKKALFIVTIISVLLASCRAEEVRNPDLAKNLDPSCNMVKTTDGNLVYTEADARANFGGNWNRASLSQDNCIITISRFRKSNDPNSTSTIGEAIVVTPGDQEIFNKNSTDPSAIQLADISEKAVLRGETLYIQKGLSYLSVKCVGENICTEANYAKAGKVLSERLP